MDDQKRDPLTWEEGVATAIRSIEGAYASPDLPWTQADLRLMIDALIAETDGATRADDLDQSRWDGLWGVFGATGLQLWKAGLGYGRQRSAEAVAVAALAAKHHDYGPNNIARFGRTGLIVRAHDKVARIENLTRRGGDGKNEAIEDTYFDCLGYAAIAFMWDRGWFHLPLAADLEPSAA